VPAGTVGSLRLLLVVNSFASSVTARNKVLIHQTLSNEHDVAIVETNRRGHATRFAQDAASRGVDVVVAVGGDGTLNEVANGLAGSATALAVLPGGSTNVFARTIGLPNDPVAAADRLAEGLAHRSIERVGLGVVNGRYFAFHTGIGFDATIVRFVEKRGSIKRWFGHPLFMYAGVRTWVTDYDRRRPHFTVCAGNGSEPFGGAFTIVLNTNPYTFLGDRPFDLVPGATLDQPLAAVTFTKLSARTMLPSFLGALRGGGLKPSSTVIVQRELERLVIEHDQPFPYQVDGDYLGETKRLEFRHAPNIIDLVTPLAQHPPAGEGERPTTTPTTASPAAGDLPAQRPR